MCGMSMAMSSAISRIWWSLMTTKWFNASSIFTNRTWNHSRSISEVSVKATLYSTVLLAGCWLSRAGVAVDPCAPWQWCCAPVWNPDPALQTRTAAQCCSAPARTAEPPVGKQKTFDICSRANRKANLTSTFESYIWMYSSMMAVDFLLTSSSLKEGLLGACGGGGVTVDSRFTVHTRRQKKPICMSEFKTNLATK